MPLANSFLAPATLLLSLLASLRLTLLLLPASFLRKDSLSKRRHSKHHHHRNKSWKNSRKPFHTPSGHKSERSSWAINPAYATPGPKLYFIGSIVGRLFI
jgi:hypothetical protein